MDNNPSVRPKMFLSKQEDLPEGEPLDQRKITYCDKNGGLRSCSALHPRFSHFIIFPLYEEPVVQGDGTISVLEVTRWMEQTCLLQQALHTLLRLPHQRFWATVSSEVSLLISLESYLRHGPRFYAYSSHKMTDQMNKLTNQVHDLVLRVMYRMSTQVEAQDEFISKVGFTNLITRLMDLSKLVDLASLYWIPSRDQVRKTISDHIFKNCFLANPKFEGQLVDMVCGFLSFLNAFKESLGLDDPTISSNASLPALGAMTWNQVQSAVHTICDFSVTLFSLLSAYPPIGKIFQDNSLDHLLVTTYDPLFHHLGIEVDKRSDPIPGQDHSDEVVIWMRKQIVWTKCLFVMSFRKIVTASFLIPLMDQSLPVSSKAGLMETMFDTLGLVLCERTFAMDYFNKYPLEEDVNSLRTCEDVTAFNQFSQLRVNDLRDEVKKVMKPGVRETLSMEEPQNQLFFTEREWRRRKKEDRQRYPRQILDQATSGRGPNGNVSSWKSLPVKSIQFKEDYDTLKSEETTIEEVELISLVSSVKGILPELGEGFIEAVLTAFNFNQETALNSLLTEDLPLDVAALDRNLSTPEYRRMKLQAEKPRIEPVHEVIASRKNVFDGDEFDIHRNESIDLSRVIQGKKDKDAMSQKEVTTLKKKTLQLNEMIIDEKEAEIIEMLGFIGVTDPNDIFIN